MSKKIALVTGASRGIGWQIAQKLVTDGFDVISPSRQELDLSSDSSIDSFISNFDKSLAVLVNNAGINPLGEIINLVEKDIEMVMKINLLSPLKLIRGFAPLMISQRYGRVVNISSVWSVISKPKRGLYSIAKSGLNALSRSLAVELGNYNILVNSVAPGFVDTELTRKNLSAEEIKTISSQIPLGRLANTDEIAKLVSFLCSEDNTYITGQTIIVDGGYTCL